MKKILSALLTIFFTTTTLFESGALAVPFSGSVSTSAGTSASQLGQIAESAGPVQAFQADLFTGRAQTSVPIFVPPGRKNVQPNLNLSYSSSGGSGWLGSGWALDLGFIQRDTKKGVPSYASSDKKIFSFQGVQSELVEISPNEYRSKDEALFLKFIYDPSTDSWTITDKSGTKHYFGTSAASKQTSTLGTFKWMFVKMVDTSGNVMTVTHTSDGGQPYLASIDYNGNAIQSFASTHRVEFTLEDRPDKTFFYNAGSRVDNNKRLKEILVKVKDAQGVYRLSRKYTIAYEISSATKVSRLKTITECGRDAKTCLPPTTFTYQDNALGFNALSDFSGLQRVVSANADYDLIRKSNSSGSVTADFFDINGDGRPDRVQAVNGNTNWKVQFNLGNSFGALTDFGPLHKPTSSTDWDMITKAGSSGEMISDLADLNGDGLSDRILSQTNNTSWQVQINNGNGFNAVTNWTGIQRMLTGDWAYDYSRYVHTTDTGVGTWYTQTQVDLIDMNGDGLPDRVMSQRGNANWKVQLNTGTGFSAMTDWGPIENWYASNTSYPEVDRYTQVRFSDTANQTLVDLMDLNGDGLPDRVQSNSNLGVWKVQWNTGRGFTSIQDFGPIQSIAPTQYWGNRTCVRLLVTLNPNQSPTNGEEIASLADLNGDGLADRVESNGNSSWSVQFNNGKGFEIEQVLNTPIEAIVATSQYFQIRWQDPSSGMLYSDLADINGDGLADRIQAQSGNTSWKIQTAKGPSPDLLKQIENGRGGKTTITYSPSTSFDNKDTNGKERLPFPIQVVTQVKQEDGFGNSYVTNYSYKGGMFDATEREFRGFREVTVTDVIGTKTIHTFYQTTCKKGRLISKEVRDAQNNLYSKEVTTWSEIHPYTGVHFAFVSQQDNYLYDSSETPKQTRQTFTYDAYGNLATTNEEGDISIFGDERTTTNTYVYNTTAYILNTLSKTSLSKSSTIYAERYFFYDAANKGLLIKEEEWLNTACPAPGSGCAGNPTTQMTYDAFGNVLTVTDARGYITTNTYDSTYKLFLIQIKNALNQTRCFTYDPWIAQILTSTDQNNQVTQTIYDALGRVTKVIAPLDSTSEPTQEFVYDLTSFPNKTITKVKSSVPGQPFTQLVTYSFVDGLGREIQRRSPAEDPTKQIISGIVEFDERGQVKKQYVPYFDNLSATYQAPSTTQPKATFTYDSLGRRTRIDYPDATNSQVSFNQFVKTTTDARGKQLRYTNDAYGRLIKVEEFSGGQTYTTLYEYDILNNLKKTTDNAGNITTINYDSLSRKTGMTDPDMGTWSYTYDKNDNLISQVDAKNQTISFTYDALNRVTLKNLPGAETDAAYIYDDVAVPYAKGRLTKVTDASGEHKFIYDALGRVTSDETRVDNIPYTFTRTYDSMGRVRTLTYPDTEVVTYTYNGFGDVETIQGTTSYVKEVNYNASGQITFIKYGNNVTSDYTYNPQTLRLDKILTKKPDGISKLQDLSYQFDGVGNVTHISDVVNSMTQDFTYDDLNRLIQATGSAYGTQSFTYDSIGNMTNKAGRIMTYGVGGSKPHAVTAVSGSLPSFCHPEQSEGSACVLNYDANGNMTQRGSDSLSYDSENRLKEVKSYEAQDGSQTYTLKPGWNVISFPYLPANKSITNVLSSLTFGVDYDQVSTWSSALGAWRHFVNDSDFNDFTEFEYGKTYEIYNNSGVDKTLTVSGKSRGTDITHNLIPGDNFISPAVKQSETISSLLGSWNVALGSQISDIKRFNATTQSWESFSTGAFTQFEPGKGYNLIALTNSSFNYGKTETTTSFVYDSTGARVKKITPQSTTLYLGKDYDVVGSLKTKYIFLGDRRISMKDSSGTLLFYHEDHINSSNVITDANGNSAALYEYDPYGTTVTHTGTVEIKHRFTGQEADDSSRLYFYNHRYYDSQLGRFITSDPTVQHLYDPQDMNRYAYARNNPIRFTDPTGLGWLSKLFAVIGAIIATAFVPASAPLWAFMLAGAVGGAIGGLAGAAIEKSSLLRGALDGAAIGAAVGAGAYSAQGGGAGASAGGGGGSGDLGGMNAAFRPDQTQGYIYINGSAVREGTAEGLKSTLGKGLGLARDVVKAIGSQIMPAAYGMTAATITPGPGGLNSDQQLSRFKEDTRSKESPEIVTLYHYGYMADSASIRASGLRPGSFGTPDFYTSGSTAEDMLSLPPSAKYPGRTRDARYALQVDLGMTEVVWLGRAAPNKAAGQKGGGYEVLFPKGVPPEAVKSVDKI